MLIRFGGFTGENRAINPKLLADGVCTLSRNQKPGRGDLRPWRNPLNVATVPAGRKTIYRMGRDTASDATYWLSWTTRVHAVRGFDADDTTERTYYTGDGAPKVTDNIMALASAPYPTASRPLGIPAPATAMTGTVSGGAASSEAYVYTYTHVSDWGWESAPAPGLTITRPTDATVTLTSFAAAPSGNHQINRIRIYRTQTGGSSTEFFFLREIALGTTTTTDDNRALGDVLETMNWLPAPADLKHLTAMWNGMLAGISGNSVRFCEAYVPYAWPSAYDAIPPDSKPVALGVFGQSLLVLTTGRPLLVAGSGPDSLDQQPLEFSQACSSDASVVSMGAGVAWASEDGLCWYGAGGPRLLTAGIMTRDDWQAINPRSITACMYEGLYFGSYLDGSTRRGFMIDPTNPTGIYFLDKGYEAMHFDELQDQLYVLDGINVQRWDAGPTSMTVRARSKTFRTPLPANFGALEVITDTYPVSVAIEAQGMDPAEVAALVADFGGVLSAPISTTLRYQVSVAGKAPIVLPGGFSASDWTVDVEAIAPVLGVPMASTIDELRAV